MALFQNPANPANSFLQQPAPTGGLFSQPSGQGSSLFGQPSGQASSLFSSTPSQGGPQVGVNTLFSNPSSTASVGSSLFGNSTTAPSSSLFGSSNSGTLLSNQGPSSAGTIFGASPSTGQTSVQPGLFNSVPSGGAPNTMGAGPSPATGGNAGGLFGSGSTTGGLFGGGSATSGLFGASGASTQGGSQPGLFGANPSGSMFGSTPATSLFGQTSNAPQGAPLFGANSGSLFGQSSLFNNPPTPSFGGQGPLTPSIQGNVAFVPYQNFSDKMIDNFNQTEKDNLFGLKNQIENNENCLIQAENTLSKITKFKDDIKNRLQELFAFARKVQTAEKRCKASLEIVKKFQGNISLFIKDAVKVFDRCERADGFNQIDSPGVFLSDMLANCEERLKSIEESFKEIQELVLIEERSNEFILLIKTIAMMQTKFELVSSLTFDMHKRVLEVTGRYSMTFGIDFDENSGKDMKIKEVSKSLKTSSLADLIAARPNSTSYRFP